MSSKQSRGLMHNKTETVRDETSGSKDLVWHQQPPDVALEILKSNPCGLTTEEAQKRLAEHGPNAIDLKDRRTPARILLNQFTDFMILILMAAAVLSGIIGDIKDTIVIAAIVLLNGAIGFI